MGHRAVELGRDAKECTYFAKSAVIGVMRVKGKIMKRGIRQGMRNGRDSRGLLHFVQSKALGVENRPSCNTVFECLYKQTRTCKPIF